MVRAAATLLIFGLALGAGGPASAQQPTPEQQDAVKANCRSDFMANCMGVPRGGSEAFQCLKQNLAKLSPGCKQAVSAIGAKPAAPAPAPAAAAPPPAAPAPVPATAAPAPAPAPSAPAPAPASTAPAPAATAAPAPAAAPTAAPVPAKKAVAAPPPAASPPPVAAPAPPSVIVATPLQIFGLVRTSCRAEYRAYCSQVEAGGGRVIACLQENAASLSPTCREGLAALGR